MTGGLGVLHRALKKLREDVKVEGHATGALIAAHFIRTGDHSAIRGEDMEQRLCRLRGYLRARERAVKEDKAERAATRLALVALALVWSRS